MSRVSAFLSVGATRIHYFDWPGNKPPLLIVHGNTHAGGVYAPLAEKLSKDFRVVAVDLRGHGQSSKTDDYSWPAMAGDITALIDHLDLRDLTVVAHSRGGGVAMVATCLRRERVRALVVFEPTVPLRLIDANMSEEDERVWAKARLAKSEGRRSTFPSREAAYTHYKGRGSFKEWQDEYLHAFIEHCLVDTADGSELASALEVESQLVLARPGMEGWSGLGKCDVPVLALFGANSGRIGNPSNDSRAAIANLFPDTRIEVIPGTTHSAPMERPDLFEGIVRSFSQEAPSHRR